MQSLMNRQGLSLRPAGQQQRRAAGSRQCMQQSGVGANAKAAPRTLQPGSAPRRGAAPSTTRTNVAKPSSAAGGSGDASGGNATNSGRDAVTPAALEQLAAAVPLPEGALGQPAPGAREKRGGVMGAFDALPPKVQLGIIGGIFFVGMVRLFLRARVSVDGVAAAVL
jgi:hypothetical protein